MNNNTIIFFHHQNQNLRFWYSLVNSQVNSLLTQFSTNLASKTQKSLPIATKQTKKQNPENKIENKKRENHQIHLQHQNEKHQVQANNHKHS